MDGRVCLYCGHRMPEGRPAPQPAEWLELGYCSASCTAECAVACVRALASELSRALQDRPETPES
jgi:hypothetical protein